jgi:hypothetical protein
LIFKYPNKKRIFLFFSISLNLGTLFFFKYAQFIALNVLGFPLVKINIYSKH